MTRPRHVHALVRPAIGRRKPVVHGPAFRLTAVLTGLAIAATALAATSSHASAAGRSPARRPAPAAKGIPARAAGLEPLHRPASRAPGADHRVPLAAVAASNRNALNAGRPPARPGPTAPAGSAPTRPKPVTGHEAPPLLPAPDVPPRDAAHAEPREAAPPGAAPQGTTSPRIPDSRRLEQRFVKEILRRHGIGWRSTGDCSDRTVTTCTSFEKIRWGTIKGLIDFAKSSGCEITVTGGTERGHASGTYSHWNGHKADIAPGRCVDRAIERYTSAGVRGDGARLYRSPDGALFARERDHWDITFR